MGVTEEPKEVNEKQEEVPGFALTKEFLEYAFDKKVKTFSVNVGTNPGDNYLSIMFAVDVNFEDEPATQHYLIKCYPNHPGRREFLDELNVFEKELFMYNEFHPALRQMAKESGADEDIVNISLAPFHGGSVAVGPTKKFANTQWSNENFLIMTDMRKAKKNYKMSNRMNGLDKEHATLVLKEMAKLHALTWAYKQKNGLKLLSSKYPEMVDKMYCNEELGEKFKPMMMQMIDNTLKIVEESLGEGHPAYQNAKKFLESDYTAIMRQFTGPEGPNEDAAEEILRLKPEEDKEYNKEPWLTGNHGDCWVNNFLFHHDEIEGQSRLKDVLFVDFQVFREACPTIDIAYFLFSSVRASIRNTYKDALLKAYYEAFLVSCNELKVSPYSGFSFSSLKRRFRRAEIYGMLISMPLLNIVLKPVGESVDLDKSDGKKDGVELFSSVLEGTRKNTALNDEVTSTILSMYEDGIL